MHSRVSFIVPILRRGWLIFVDASREPFKRASRSFRQRSFRVGAQQVTSGKRFLFFCESKRRPKWERKRPNELDSPGDLISGTPSGTLINRGRKQHVTLLDIPPLRRDGAAAPGRRQLIFPILSAVPVMCVRQLCRH